jgi:hypothetical protein
MEPLTVNHAVIIWELLSVQQRVHRVQLENFHQVEILTIVFYVQLVLIRQQIDQLHVLNVQLELILPLEQAHVPHAQLELILLWFNQLCVPRVKQELLQM